MAGFHLAPRSFHSLYTHTSWDSDMTRLQRKKRLHRFSEGESIKYLSHTILVMAHVKIMSDHVSECDSGDMRLINGDVSHNAHGFGRANGPGYTHARL